MENFKGGALLGGLMTGVLGGVTTGKSVYDYVSKQFPTTKLLSDLYATKLENEETIRKA